MNEPDEVKSVSTEPYFRQHLENLREQFLIARQNTSKGQPPPTIETFLEGLSGTQRSLVQHELEKTDQEFRRSNSQSQMEARDDSKGIQASAQSGETERGNQATLAWEREKDPHDEPALAPRKAPNAGDVTVEFVTGEERVASVAAGRVNVPGYDILSVLGCGGMGIVYKARHLRLNRLVALKMMSAGGHASPEHLARFYAEAEAVARLHHPNIIEIYEVCEVNGLPFFSLEYVDGGTLAQVTRGQPQQASDSARLVQCLARAMDYAHLNGIIHRDLKPANVLLNLDGVPKISDFGLAKILESDSSQTRSGTLMGTPSYMAPEQARGDVKAVGPAADIYALGAVLYEQLVGRPPFAGATILETLKEVQEQEPAPPRRFQPKIPRDLETICLKCLEKDAKKRYPSAGALADDLGWFLVGKPIQARPISGWERLGRWCYRNPRVAILLGTVALLLVVLTIGSLAAAYSIS